MRFFRILPVFATMLAAMLAGPAQASPEPAIALYPPNESMLFKMKFIDTTAGECLFETLAPTTWEGRPAHHFRATVRTVGLIWVIYPYYETVDLYFDREKQLPLFVDINLHDRKKVQHTQIRLDAATQRGEELEDSTEPGTEPHHRRKNWTITPGSQSLFSIIHYLRASELKSGSRVMFPVSHDEKNSSFAAEVVAIETVHAGGKDQDAIVLKVLPSFTKDYYPNVQEMPQIWLSNDGQKRLLKFEFKHKLGRVFGSLQPPGSS